MITAGPMIEKYARKYGCEVGEVVDWMNGYISGPWPDGLDGSVEKTSREREASVKRYVAGQA